MKKKLVKHGNSLALIIDAPILSILKLDPNDILEITTDGVSLIITKAILGDKDDGGRKRTND